MQTISTEQNIKRIKQSWQCPQCASSFSDILRGMGEAPNSSNWALRSCARNLAVGTIKSWMASFKIGNLDGDDHLHPWSEFLVFMHLCVGQGHAFFGHAFFNWQVWTYNNMHSVVNALLIPCWGWVDLGTYTAAARETYLIISCLCGFCTWKQSYVNN